MVCAGKYLPYVRVRTVGPHVRVHAATCSGLRPAACGASEACAQCMCDVHVAGSSSSPLRRILGTIRHETSTKSQYLSSQAVIYIFNRLKHLLTGSMHAVAPHVCHCNPGNISYGPTECHTASIDAVVLLAPYLAGLVELFQPCQTSKNHTYVASH